MCSLRVTLFNSQHSAKLTSDTLTLSAFDFGGNSPLRPPVHHRNIKMVNGLQGFRYGTNLKSGFSRRYTTFPLFAPLKSKKKFKKFYL